VPPIPAEKFDEGCGRGARAVTLRGPLCGHLRVTGMARLHLDNRRRRAFIPRIVFRARRGHDTPACGKSASGREILRSRGRPTSRPRGAPGGAAPVQRASQTRWIGRRVSRAGVATPFVRRVPGASSAPARGLASPWRLPALHSLSERKKGTGGPAPAKQQGRRSVGYIHSSSSRAYLCNCVSRAQRSMKRSVMMRCRPGIVTNSESATIPDQRCTASRCTASGKRRKSGSP
jgi:hypothetical protein